MRIQYARRYYCNKRFCYHILVYNVCVFVFVILNVWMCKRIMAISLSYFAPLDQAAAKWCVSFVTRRPFTTLWHARRIMQQHPFTARLLHFMFARIERST